MADPITWGLINLVKKGVKGVQTTLDGVSDKVSGLPDSLSADFTQVKQAIADVKTDVGGVNTAVSNVNTAVSGVKTDVGSVNTAVSSVKEDTTSIKDTVDTSLLLSADSVVKSVQRGGSIITAGTGNASDQYTVDYNINISNITVSKSAFFVNIHAPGGNNYSADIAAYATLSSNAIRVRAKNLHLDGQIGVTWSVIEFY